MNRYETIASLGESFINLTGMGLMPVHIMDWKLYYEAFLKEMEYERRHFKRPRKTHAAGCVAEQYGITERTVFKIIAFMEGS